MSKSYIFDVDGTLTLPRQKMELNFAFYFASWMSGKSVFLVSGSDIDKLKEQVPHNISHRCEGIFSSMANELWQEEKLIYEKEFSPPFELIEMLTSFQMYAKFPIRVKSGGRGEIIEYRSGMINFTTIGRNASIEERNKYCQWDQETGERKLIAKEVESKFPELEARIGGQISIDIQPKGNNKSQASKWIRKNLRDEMIFFGDKCFKGGNDYDIALDIMKNKDGKYYQVDSYKETKNILTSL